MKPSSLIDLMIRRIEAGIQRPVLILGAPGGGKTEICGQAAAHFGTDFGYTVLHAPLMQPEDYGLPVVSADKTSISFAIPSEKFPFEGMTGPERGLLLIDELTQSDASTQKILTNLIHARELHGRKLKPGWFVAATGNRAQDRAGANAVLTHLKDRVKILNFEISLDDWTQWALKNDIRPEVIAFIRFKPGLLSNFEASKEKSATPRGWSQGVSRDLGTVPAELEFESIMGDVGEGPAGEFCGFLKVFRRLPNPDSILLDPKKAPVPGPKELDVMYALCGALVARVTDKNFDRALTYIRRLPPEFSVLFVKDATVKNPDLLQTKAFIDWASKEGADLLT